jgi:integrase
MKLLPNGCKCSDIKVIPKNWKTGNKSLLKKDWMIYYRFYDDAQEPSKRVKLIRLKQMNEFHTLEDRRAATKALLEAEWILLSEKCYNHITGTYLKEPEIDYEIHPDTYFVKALEEVLPKLKFEYSTLKDIKSVVGVVKKAAIELHYNTLPIKDVRRRHIKILLAHIQATKENSSPHRYNRFRWCLMLLFNELLEMEATEVNPMSQIKKMPTIQKMRVTLSLEERKIINKYLLENYYNFWRFTQIFFHSGGRIIELFRLKVSDVDLENQRYKVLIKKGKQSKEVWKTIKNIAVPFWAEILKDANQNDFVFSEQLKAGLKQKKSDYVSKWWYRHIKDKLKIKADFYSLKHTNLDEISILLSIEDASKMASHTNLQTTQRFYLFGEAERQHQRLKEVNNQFA